MMLMDNEAEDQWNVGGPAIAAIIGLFAIAVGNHYYNQNWKEESPIKRQCEQIKKDFAKAMAVGTNLPALEGRKMKVSFYTKIETSDSGERLKNPLLCTDILAFKS